MSEKMKIFYLALFIGCTSSLATDLYLPSLPDVSTALHTSIKQVQFSLPLFVFSLAFSQLIYGPLSEALGRRMTILLGLGIMLIGSVATFLAPHISVLLIGRFFQGLGAGAPTALWRSLFRDNFNEHELARYASYLTLLVTFIIPAAPALGGVIHHFLGWRGNFGLILCYNLAVFLLVYYFLHETNVHIDSSNWQIKKIKQFYLEILTHPEFRSATFSVCCTYGAFFGWFVILPVLLIKQMGLSTTHFGGLLFLVDGCAMFLGSVFNTRLVEKKGSAFMMKMGWLIMIVAGLLLSLSYFIFAENLVLILFSLFLTYFGTALVWPNGFSLAFKPFGHIAGYAGASYGFLQQIGGAFFGAIAALLPAATPLPIALFSILLAVIAWSLFHFFSHQKERVS